MQGWVAIALNTGYLDAEAAGRAIEQVKAKTRVPCTDAVRLLTADIALAVGFADHSQFTRHFKRIVGVTPKRIRKK